MNLRNMELHGAHEEIKEAELPKNWSNNIMDWILWGKQVESMSPHYPKQMKK